MSKLKNQNSDIEYQRIMPQDFQCEALLISLFFDDMFYADLKPILEILDSRIFYNEKHAIMFNAIKDVYHQNKDINQITIREYLIKNKLFDKIGGDDGLLSLISHKGHTITQINNYISILYQKLAYRDIIMIGHKMCNDAYDMSEYVLDIIEWAEQELQKINYIFFQDKEKSFEDAVIEMEANIAKYSNTDIKYYSTNNKSFDKAIQFGTPKEVLLFGGKSGSLKTRFIVNLMRNLVFNHKDEVSILWYCMEDNYDKIIRLMIAPKLKLTDTEMQGKDYKLNQMELHSIINEFHTMKKNYDIEFVDKPSKVSDMNRQFFKFCTKRKGKFCILIIDNLMLIGENDDIREQTKADDTISREIKKISDRTNRNGLKSSIILLHHFTDSQLDKANIKEAYRPRETHLKGSTRYRDICTQIILLNWVENYQDLKAEYRGMEEIFQHLFITEIVKNRNIGVTDTIRWWTLPGYALFKEIEITESQKRYFKEKGLSL